MISNDRLKLEEEITRASFIAKLNAARAEIERLKDSQRWIPVSERVPEVDELRLKSDPVLAYNGVIWTAIFWKYGTWMDDTRYENLDNITHWMSLPKPPEVVE
jgi:hypothetical protein